MERNCTSKTNGNDMTFNADDSDVLIGPHINKTGFDEKLQFLNNVSGILTMTVWYRLHSADVITNNENTINMLFDSRTGNIWNRMSLTEKGPFVYGNTSIFTNDDRATYYTNGTGIMELLQDQLYTNNEKFVNKDGGTTLLERNETDLPELTDNIFNRANVWTCATFVMPRDLNDDITFFGKFNANDKGLSDVEIGPILMYNRELSAEEVTRNYRVKSAIYKNY